MCSLTLELGSLLDAALGTPTVENVNFTVLHTVLHIILHKLNLSDLQVEVKDPETATTVNKLYESLPEKEPALLMKDFLIKNGEKVRNYCANVKNMKDDSLITIKRNWQFCNAGNASDACDFVEDECQAMDLKSQINSVKKYVCKNIKKNQTFLTKRVDNIECELALFRNDLRKSRKGEADSGPINKRNSDPTGRSSSWDGRTNQCQGKSSTAAHECGGGPMDLASQAKFNQIEKHLCEIKKKLKQFSDTQQSGCSEKKRSCSEHRRSCSEQRSSCGEQRRSSIEHRKPPCGKQGNGKNLIKINVVQNDKCNQESFDVYVDDQLCKQPSARCAYSDTSISTARTMDEPFCLSSDRDSKMNRETNISSKCPPYATKARSSSSLRDKRNSTGGKKSCDSSDKGKAKPSCPASLDKEVEQIWCELHQLKMRLECMDERLNLIAESQPPPCCPIKARSTSGQRSSTSTKSCTPKCNSQRNSCTIPDEEINIIIAENQKCASCGDTDCLGEEEEECAAANDPCGLDGASDDGDTDYMTKCNLRKKSGGKKKVCPSQKKPPPKIGGGCGCKKPAEEDPCTARKHPCNRCSSVKETPDNESGSKPTKRRSTPYDTDKIQQRCAAEKDQADCVAKLNKCPLQVPPQISMEMDNDYSIKKCNLKCKPENLPPTSCPPPNTDKEMKLEKFSKEYCQCLAANKLRKETEESGLAALCAARRSQRSERRSSVTSCEPTRKRASCKCDDADEDVVKINIKNNKCDTEPYNKASSFKKTCNKPVVRTGKKSLSRTRDEPRKSNGGNSDNRSSSAPPCVRKRISVKKVVDDCDCGQSKKRCSVECAITGSDGNESDDESEDCFKINMAMNMSCPCKDQNSDESCDCSSSESSDSCGFSKSQNKNNSKCQKKQNNYANSSDMIKFEIGQSADKAQEEELCQKCMKETEMTQEFLEELCKRHERLSNSHEAICKIVFNLQSRFQNVRNLFENEICTKKRNMYDEKLTHSSDCPNACEDNSAKFNYVSITDENVNSIRELNDRFKCMQEFMNAVRDMLEDMSKDVCNMQLTKLDVSVYEADKVEICADLEFLKSAIVKMMCDNEQPAACCVSPYVRNACCLACAKQKVMLRDETMIPKMPCFPVKIPHSLVCNPYCDKKRFVGGSHTMLNALNRQVRIINKYPPNC